MRAVLETGTLLKMISFGITVCLVFLQISEGNIQTNSPQKNAMKTFSTSPPPISRHSQQSTAQFNSQTSSRSVTSLPQDSATRTTAGRLNYYDPVFKEEAYYEEVQETTPIRTLILTVTAFDIDPDGRISYRLEGSQQTLDTFSIDAQSGDITLLQKLNYSRTSVYNFEVVAMDDVVNPRFARAKVEVVVLGENLNRPVFEEEYYEAKVDEDVPISTSVLQVLAIDPDVGKDLID